MQALTYISSALTPLVIAATVIFGLIKRVDVYSAFAAGAKRGAGLCFRIMPYIVAMIFAVRMFEASGAFDWICRFLAPAFGLFGIPAQLVPVMLMRPFSGGASLGLLAGIFAAGGADTYAGRVASTYMGSSETLFYTVSLYFGSVGVKRTRYVVPVALATDFLGMALSCFICRLL